MATNYAIKYDLRYVDGPIRDQGSLGSCWAFATTTIVDTIMRQAGHELPLLSPLALYSAIRTAQNTFYTDSGTYQAGGEYAATKFGFATEASWSYNENNLYTQLPQSVVEEAAHIKVTSFTRMNIDVNYTTLANEVRDMLGQGKPVLLSFKPQAYFFNETSDLNTTPNLGQNGHKSGHAVEIIGMDDNLNGGSYIVHNSWNTSWGDNGYGVISYKQFIPSGFIDDLMGMYTIDGVKMDNNVFNFVYTKERVNVAAYYATILERAPEVSGLDFWASKSITHTQLADLLINSVEGQAMYGKQTNTQFVENMYENVLGRHSDAAGLAYFVGFLDNGQSRGQVISGMIDYLYANSADKDSHQYLVNKVNVASYISIASQYSGGNDAATHTILEQVTIDVNATEILKVGIPDIIHPLIA